MNQTAPALYAVLLVLAVVGCASQNATTSTANTSSTSTGAKSTSTGAESTPSSGTTTKEASAAATTAAGGQEVALSSGLKYVDLKVGDGTLAEKGMTANVHYTGWLTDGTKFDSSVDRGQPFQFMLGAGSVIRGWDEGVAGMRVGGKRKLMIPPSMGYGERGAGGLIPPNADLVFEVELLGVK